MLAVSQTDAEANFVKTMKASPTPLVTLNKFTYKVGLCFDPSGRVALLGGGPTSL